MSIANPEIDFSLIVDMSKEVIENSFGQDRVHFSFVCGSLAKAVASPMVVCRPNSDVDLFVCLKDEPKLVELESFRSGYFDMHERLGRCPDTQYPGEVMTSGNLLQALGLASVSTPSLRLEDPEVYDGIVWAGMLYSPKLIIHRSGPALCRKSATGSAVVNAWCRALNGQFQDKRTYSADLILKNGITYEQ